MGEPRSVILVHGTKLLPRLMSSPAWTSEGSAMRTTIVSTHPRVEVTSFEWRGGNRFLDRRTAAIGLAERIRGSDQPVTIVAHSHGGNVALDAVRRSGLERQDVRVVAIGTPFLSMTRWDADKRSFREPRMLVLVLAAEAGGACLVRPAAGWFAAVLVASLVLVLCLAVIAVEPSADLGMLTNEPELTADLVALSVPRDEAALTLKFGRLVDRLGQLVEDVGWMILALIGLVASLAVGLSLFTMYQLDVEATGSQPSTWDDVSRILNNTAGFVNEEFPMIGPSLLVGGSLALVATAVFRMAYWSCGWDAFSFAAHGRLHVSATPDAIATVHRVLKPPAAGRFRHTALTSDPTVIELVTHHIAQRRD